MNVPKKPKTKRTIWKYALADFVKANELLSDMCIDEYLDNSMDQAWSKWEQEFMLVMSQCIPTTSVKLRNCPPWLSYDLLKAIRSRNSSYRLARKTGNADHLACYKKKRNRVANMIKSAKSNFFDQLDPSTPKAFWKTTRYLTKQKSSIPELKDNCGQSITDDTEKATLLNDYFTQCFNTAVPKLDTTSFNCQYLDPSCCPEELLCSEDEVTDLLLSLNTSKANGPDGISATMLKSTAYSIAPGLTKLFNKSISTGQLPSPWKTSSIVPIPKGNDKSSVTNYRPISLLSILSKILERHMYWQIATHLEMYSPNSLHQWGFQPKKSTTAALLDVYNNWAMEIDRGNEVCAIFFDLRKAFDSVPHRKLVEKLVATDMNPYILKWIICYLSNRSQYVVLNGEKSPTTDVISGVPQGSVLGPLLFLIYINDAEHGALSDGSVINLFADDTLFYRVITSSLDYTKLQNDIDTFACWVNDNVLTLNAGKCKYMVISKRKSRAIPCQTMMLYNKPMDKVSSYKYLGVTICNDLAWSTHIDKIASKTRQLIGMLYRRFYKWSSSNALLQLYLSLIRPHLEYATQVWSPHQLKDIQKLEAVQKFALKVCLKRWDSSYSELLDLSGIPKLADRRKLLCLTYFYKAVNGHVTLPDGIIVPRVCVHNTRSSSRATYVQPFASTNTYQHSFFSSTISLWNSLPQSVTSAPSVQSFKRSLLNYF